MCDQVIYSWQCGASACHSEQTQHDIFCVWESDEFVYQSPGSTSNSLFTEESFIHSTATTNSLGDIINNVDYTIKHRGMRKKKRKQSHALQTSKETKTPFILKLLFCLIYFFYASFFGLLKKTRLLFNDMIQHSYYNLQYYQNKHVVSATDWVLHGCYCYFITLSLHWKC